MASTPASAKADRLSFAKIAAAGLKAPAVQQSPTAGDSAKRQAVIASLPDGATVVAPSTTSTPPPAFTPKSKTLVPYVLNGSKETGATNTDRPQVNVEIAEAVSPPEQTPRPLDGMLMPSSDDAGTQLSSSTGSAKPPSLDGHSVTSGTTFALDEKESLRPDDSASVKATEDEDSHSRAESGAPGSRSGSNDDVRAFRDQLMEISGMEPPGHLDHVPGFALRGIPSQPLFDPQAPSGGLPLNAHDPPASGQVMSLPPDPKLLEALESPKDRIMVLKLEQDFVDFVKDAKESSLKLPQTNAFYRMLAHKLADYYMLGHLADESASSVRIYKTETCHLPPPLTGIATPSTAASTPPPVGPQMKILRRGVGPTIANGSHNASLTTSENGESGNDDDKKQKLPVSRQEREANYAAARKRIMGSPKPTDSPEASEKDISRSSSAAGRKSNRRKHRHDSDDDFEARSAYSTYYPSNVTSSEVTPVTYGIPQVDSPSTHFAGSPYSNQTSQGSYQQYVTPPPQQWTNPGFHGHDGTLNWMQNQQPGYDLSGDFQRAMSFRPPPPMMNQTPATQPAYGAQYNQQYTNPHQTWPVPPQNPYVPSYPSQLGQINVQGYPSRPQSSNQFHEGYAYGQLPSQTFPGRQPSKLEHPIPGSYKGKHFNPQSQSFVPAQTTTANVMPYSPQALHQSPLMNYTPGGSTYNMSGYMQQQTHAGAPSQPYGLPQQSLPSNGTTSTPNRTLTHPLPQPVFPRQPSPNVPLPPKPEATPPRPAPQSNSGPAIVSSTESIAKWDRPASLPAKPPPPAETKFVHGSGQRLESFSMVPRPVNGMGLNGSGYSMQTPRRA